ncbi:sugar ABC transporter permease [bacterium]|nr:sugar ABC transporter permease [bacterium]
MASPALLGLTLFVALPFLLALGLSFTNLRLGSPLPTQFVGWESYRRLAADPAFRQALINNLLFAAVVVPTQTGIALGLALMLNRPLRGMSIFRTFFFMPVVFPMSLLAVVWKLIYAPGPDGPANTLLSLISFGAWGPFDYLHDARLALPAIMLMSIWQGVGFQMVVLLAGLQSIPRVLYEAAALDGADSGRQFVHITIPQLRNPLIFTALVTGILAFRLFDQVQIMTRGGPRNATTTMMYEAVVTAFEKQQIGQAAAITVVFFAIVLALTWMQRALLRQERSI